MEKQQENGRLWEGIEGSIIDLREIFNNQCSMFNLKLHRSLCGNSVRYTGQMATIYNFGQAATTKNLNAKNPKRRKETQRNSFASLCESSAHFAFRFYDDQLPRLLHNYPIRLES